MLVNQLSRTLVCHSSRIKNMNYTFVHVFIELARHGTEGGAGPTPLLWEDGAHDLGVLCATPLQRGAATGGHDGRVRLWRVQGGGRGRRVGAGAALAGHAAAVTALRWAGGLLASASLDRTARLWDTAAAACVRVLHAHSRYLTCVALAADLRYMVTGGFHINHSKLSVPLFCYI